MLDRKQRCLSFGTKGHQVGQPTLGAKFKGCQKLSNKISNILYLLKKQHLNMILRKLNWQTTACGPVTCFCKF